MLAYLWINTIDHIDSLVDLAGVNGAAYPHAFPDALRIKRLGDVGLLGKLCSGARVAFGDEVVHDDPVDVTVWEAVSACYWTFCPAWGTRRGLVLTRV